MHEYLLAVGIEDVKCKKLAAKDGKVFKTAAFIVSCNAKSRDGHTIRYDSGYLTGSKKLTGSQLSLPHGINRKLKCETKNKMMSVISPIRSRYHEAVQ